MIPKKRLILDQFYSAVIKDYYEYRMLIGEILNE